MLRPISTAVSLRHVVGSADVDAELRDALVDCWVAVSNAGGAVGFPWPPVATHDVAPVLDALVAELDATGTRLVVAQGSEGVAGWVALDPNPSPLVSHWGTVARLQTHPHAERRGVGTLLMQELTRVARAELGLEQLHLAVRGGMGLESFYERLGWREVGRWPGALRLADGDDRDDVLMHLDLL